MAKINIIQTIKSVPPYVKTHWNKPAEGEYLTLKEMAAYTAAQAGSYIFMTATGIVTFTASYFCGSVMGINQADFPIINIISMVLGYILVFLNPISILLYENHGRLTKKMKIYAHISYMAQLILGIACYFVPQNAFEDIINGLPQLVGNFLVTGAITNYFNWFIRRFFCAKHGRLKPFILSCGLPCALIVCIIPYLPVLPDQGMSYTNRLIILHFAFQLMNWFYNQFIGVNGLVTFMSPNSQERQKLHSYVPIITGLFPSIISLIFPMMIVSTGGYQSIETYKVYTPIFAVVGLALTFCAVKCKERVIEAPIEQRAKVTFLKGAKNVFKNKYLWIVNISNVIGQWQGQVTNLLSLWFVYSLRMEWFTGVASNIVVVGMTFSNILCPILTKRFQKRNILISSRALTILCVVGIALAVKMESIYVFLFFMFLRNTLSPIVDGVNVGLGADVQDYHQWKYGERSDNMAAQIFGLILNPANAAIGTILPWVFARIGHTSDWGVFYDTEILNNAFSVHTWSSVIGLILVTVPFLFYDLTKEKHDRCITELKERLAGIMDSETATEGV